MFDTKVGIVAGAVFAGWTSMATAQDGFALTVLGSDAVEHVLHLHNLDEMEQVSFSTSTIWTEGVIEFSGVSVRHILDVLMVEGTTLHLSALNDYTVQMPTTDLDAAAPIVATRMNGEEMPVREKGPFWIVYPYDQSPKYRTEVRYAQSVWQLKSLTITD